MPNDDLPPPLPGYHRDRPIDVGDADAGGDRIEVATPVVVIAILFLALLGSAAVPLIILLWKAAL